MCTQCNVQDVSHIKSLLKVKRSAPLEQPRFSQRIAQYAGGQRPTASPPLIGEPMPYDPATILEFMSLYSSNQFKSPNSSSRVSWSELLDKNEDGEPDLSSYPDYFFEEDDKGKQANVNLLKEMSGWLQKGVEVRVEHKFPKRNNKGAKRRRGPKSSFCPSSFAKWDLLMDCCNSMKTFLEHNQSWEKFIAYLKENSEEPEASTLSCFNEEFGD